jgi:DNA ligase-1
MYEPRRNAKLRLLADYFARTPDPERGWALAAMTDALVFKEAKPNLIRGLVAERVDPVLFGMSYHYVGDLAETVGLLWPAPGADLPSPLRGAGGGGAGQRSGSRRGSPDARALSDELGPTPTTPTPGPSQGGGEMLGHNNPPPDVPTLADVVEGLRTTSKSDLPARIARWLDALDETGRWALIKLITGELRVGASARLAKTAAALVGGREADEVEMIWHGLRAPYEDLFAWLEGRAGKPEASDPAPFRPPMLSHPLEDEDFSKLDPQAFRAEWKWDGIRVQAVSALGRDGRPVRRVYSRTGEDISKAFPDLVEALDFEGRSTASS